MKIIFYSLFIIIFAMQCQAADTGHPDARAIKSRLTLVFTDDFKRPDGTNLGTAWTEAAHYGAVNRRIEHHHLRFEIPDGKDIPWSSAL
jgi:hypothetical protein